MLMAAALLVLGLILAGLAVWLARALAALRADSSRSTGEPQRRDGAATAGADRGRRPAARGPRHQGRPAYGARVAADERDPQAARRRRPRDRAAGRAGQGSGTAPADAAPAQGARRVRRAPARQPARRPVTGRRLFAPVHLPQRRARRRRHPRGQARPGGRQVPARQLRAPRRRAGRGVTAAAREGVRARREDPHRRDRVEVHPSRRGHLRLRPHVPARRRRSTTSSRAGRPARCSPTRTSATSSPSRRTPSSPTCR